MHPTLFKIGIFEVRAFGALLALSFIIGIILAAKRGKKTGLDPKFIMDLGLVILVSSIIGSRFFYVIFHLEEFKGHWTDIFNPFQSSGEFGIAGLSMLGGVILAIACGIIYIILKKQPLWKIADIVAPSFVLGIGITRLGCFLNGCCFGEPTASFLGIVFPSDCAAGFTFSNVPLYPTQLFSSLKGFLIFFVVLFLERYKKFDGFTFWLMLLLFATGRFIIDFYRYYEPSMRVNLLGMDWSVNQLLSVFIFIFSGFMLRILSRRKTVGTT